MRRMDRTTCHRCNGRGYFNAFRHIINGACFSCGGTGYHLTKKGKTANAAYVARIAIAVADLVVGQRIRQEVLLGDGRLVRKTGTVGTIEPDTLNEGMVVVTTEHMAHHVRADTTFTPAMSREAAQAILDELAPKYSGIVEFTEEVTA